MIRLHLNININSKCRVYSTLGIKLYNDYNAGKFGGSTRLLATDDMNNVITPGLYYTANGIDPANHPNITNYQNALVIIYKARWDLFLQYWISYNDEKGSIWMRRIRYDPSNSIHIIGKWNEFLDRQHLYVSYNKSHYININDFLLNGTVLPNRNTSGYLKIAFPLAWDSTYASTSYGMVGFDFILKLTYFNSSDIDLPIPIHGYCSAYYSYNPSTGQISTSVPPELVLVSRFSNTKLYYTHFLYNFEDLPISKGGNVKHLCLYIRIYSYATFNLNNIMYNDNIVNNNLLDDLKITKIEDTDLPSDVTEIAYSYTNTTKITLS